MPLFGKLKSTPNLHQQNSIPWNNLEKGLKIEHLMEDIHQEYSYILTLPAFDTTSWTQT
jgi:hypothetical protein